MVSFLFWNINNKPIEEIIVRLAFRHQIDVLILAECQIEPNTLLPQLNSQQIRRANYFYANTRSYCDRIQMYTRFSDRFINPIFETDRLTIRHLQLPGKPDILLAATHFISKLHRDPVDQLMAAGRLSANIKDEETKIGSSRTLLIGDLNMDPFEDGLINASALHATMSRNLASRQSRQVQDQSYPLFLQPYVEPLG